MKNIIDFEYISKYIGDKTKDRMCMSHIECKLDISDLKKIKILSIVEHEAISTNYQYILSNLCGVFRGTYVKEEHRQFMKDNYVLSVPSDWSYEIYLDNMDILTSISVNYSAHHIASSNFIEEYYIDGEKLELIEFPDLKDIENLQKIFKPIDGVKLNQHGLNDIYNDLKKQAENILKGNK